MDMNIQDCLNIIQKLNQPVIRTCHVGNNTANVWGWLRLAKNAYAGQYDHTYYGVDENCLPWLVLKDAGILEVSFDQTGAMEPQHGQEHANQHIRRMRSTKRKYFAHLNYANRGVYKDQRIATYHYNVNTRLCNWANGTAVVARSAQVVEQREVFEQLIDSFYSRKLLDRLFNRWIRSGRKGFVASKKILPVRYYCDAQFDIRGQDGNVVFSGTTRDLMEEFFGSLSAISHSIIGGGELGKVSYPWISNYFNFFSHAIREYGSDKNQKVFWHAAGSSSQYYINDNNFRKEFDELRQLLISDGLLPEAAVIRLVPTFCCQLFATNNRSARVLNDLVRHWQCIVRHNSRTIGSAVEQLQHAQHPPAVSNPIVDSLSAEQRRSLVDLLDSFNTLDDNKLPVAHVTGLKHPTYNKYGISQTSLCGRPIIFPEAFVEMTWGELELLIKVAADLKRSQPEW